MLFNSIEFAFFLPVVFTFYWLLENHLKSQNLLIVAASYIFYGWWDWRFLSLIIFSTAIDYVIGIGLNRSEDCKTRRLLLFASIGINIGLLGFFKYCDFFITNFNNAFTMFGIHPEIETLKIILPVGISFYTFQTLSYSIDIYKRQLLPTHNFIEFAAFVSFFPQLVAGPIERATNLLPQFASKRTFTYEHGVDGLRQILWGLFKKIVIADNCAFYANLAFNNYNDHSGSTLFIGACFFSFQIYGDFSGYSDIAIGTARLFGFKLMKNFAYPYFSRDIGEFWRRWHISLSTWFRDYVYIALGGSRISKTRTIINTLVVFIVSGFWHGANWTFIIWGLINGILFLPLSLTEKNKSHQSDIETEFFPDFKTAFNIAKTYLTVLLTWVVFRAENISAAKTILLRIFSSSIFKLPEFPEKKNAIITIMLILVMLFSEWRNKKNNHPLENLEIRVPKGLRWVIYYTILLCIFWWGAEKQEFIYFQF